MTTTDKPADTTLVSCEICLKQVPASEATVSEAADYFIHFCGLECYEAWKSRREAPKPENKKSSP